MLSPLTVDKPEPHEGSDQAWIRAHALAPWRADFVLNPDRDGLWVNRRDPDMAADARVRHLDRGRRPLPQPRDRACVQGPARRARRTSTTSRRACRCSTAEQRAFLADYLARREPEHAWRLRL